MAHRDGCAFWQRMLSMHLELVEGGVMALLRGLFPCAQHQRTDGGLHEQLLKNSIHVACGPRILQPHKPARLPATPLKRTLKGLDGQ